MSPEHRRYNSLRLQTHDYSEPGAYFVTVTVHQRQHLLGCAVGGEVVCNQFGEIVSRVWYSLPDRFPIIRLDVMAVMPDHMHGIVIIDPSVESVSKPVSLSEVIRTFKALSTYQINKIRGVIGETVWQRGYYDRIIRNVEEYENIKAYILENPFRYL